MMLGNSLERNDNWGLLAGSRLAYGLGGTHQPPIKTVGAPTTIIPPCAHMSSNRAAGMLPISVVADPIATRSGGPAQTAMSVTREVSMLQTITVGQNSMTGPPTCGTTPVTIGQTWLSVIRPAGIGMGYSLD